MPLATRVASSRPAARPEISSGRFSAEWRDASARSVASSSSSAASGSEKNVRAYGQAKVHSPYSSASSSAARRLAPRRSAQAASSAAVAAVTRLLSAVTARRVV